MPKFGPNFVPKVYFYEFEMMVGKQTYLEVKKVVTNKLKLLLESLLGRSQKKSQSSSEKSSVLGLFFGILDVMGLYLKSQNVLG